MAKKLQLTQSVHDKDTGEVLHQPGKIVSEDDDLVAYAGPTAFRVVEVEDPTPAPKPEPKQTAAKKDAD